MLNGIINILAIFLPAAMAFLAMDKPKEYYIDPNSKRFKWKGIVIASLTLIFALTYAFLQWREGDIRQQQEAERDHEISKLAEATGKIDAALAEVRTIASNTDVALKETRKAINEQLDEHTKFFGEQSRSLADTAEKLRDVEAAAVVALKRINDAITLSVASTVMELELKRSELLLHRSRMMIGTAYDLLEIRLETIAANAENERSFSRLPEQHQQALIEALDNIQIDTLFETATILPKPWTPPAEQFNELVRLRDSLKAHRNSLDSKKLDLLALKTKVMQIREDYLQFRRFAEDIVMAYRTDKMQSDIDTLNKGFLPKDKLNSKRDSQPESSP